MKMKKSLVGKSNLIYKAFMIIGIILFLYYLVLKLMFGFIAFSSMFCMLGIVLIIYSFVFFVINFFIFCFAHDFFKSAFILKVYK